jgi:hypothetical protein
MTLPLNPALFARVVSHWPFNEASGTRVDDVGTNDAVVPAWSYNPGNRAGSVVD